MNGCCSSYIKPALLIGTALLARCRCEESESISRYFSSIQAMMTGPDLDRSAQDDRDPLALPGREPGPPRPEREESLQAASKEASSLLQALIEGGVARREAASVADVRGYRLYSKRRFGQARIWFEEAVRIDPGFELSRYNAARCAALLGDRKVMLRHLQALREIDTPLARTRLRQSRTDPDLAGPTPARD